MNVFDRTVGPRLAVVYLTKIGETLWITTLANTMQGQTAIQEGRYLMIDMRILKHFQQLKDF